MQKSAQAIFVGIPFSLCLNISLLRNTVKFQKSGQEHLPRKDQLCVSCETNNSQSLYRAGNHLNPLQPE